jgi:purine/pyrimidine-nucleoside phosphorylase
MLKVNEYFNGDVKSIAFSTSEGPATMGVMVPGNYEFSTSSKEYMTVVSGMMRVKLPDETEWRAYHPFETFIVQKDKKFQLMIESDTAYLCLYK